MELLLDVTERNYFISGYPATTLSSKGFHDVKIIQRRTFLNLLGLLTGETVEEEP